MKKILFLSIAILSLTACKKDDDIDDVVQDVPAETQNKYDDEAALKYLDTHYFDDRGNIKEFKANDDSDDGFKKLSELNYVKLPSGVIYIVREGAQPDPGTVIGNKDVLRLMSNTATYLATSKDNVVDYSSGVTFRSNISGNGNPEVDPSYFYVKQSILDKATSDVAKQRSYYEIEGFKEALHYFKAYNLPDDANYNLQGMIIVPSRAAFGKDPHFDYIGFSLNNRSFIFNFQIYKSSERPANQD